MRARFILGEIMTGLWRNIAMVISVVIVTAVSLTFVGTGMLMQKQIMDMKSTLVEQAQVTIYLRSEEHTSELQSRGHLVCRLLLEKKIKINDHVKSYDIN